LNPQPPVLETGTLPVELLACTGRMKDFHASCQATELFGFAVQCVFFTPRTVLIELHAGRIVATILLGCIVTLFALIARERDYRSYIFLF